MSTSKMAVVHVFKGMDSSEAVKEYAEKRIHKLDKHLHQATHVHVTYLEGNNDFVCHIHAVSGDFDARSDSADETMYAAIDSATDKIIQQSRKHKEKHTSHHGSGHHNGTND